MAIAQDVRDQQQLGKDILATLAALAGKVAADSNIQRYDGTALMIPNDWSLDKTERVVSRARQDLEAEYATHRTFHYLPWDGARAVREVVKRYFGAVIGQATQGFFSENPPELISIDVGPGVDDTEMVPWGRIALPHFDEGAYLHLDSVRCPEHGQCFVIHASCKRKEEGSIEGLFMQIQAELDANSIYRGKAITASDKPKFIDVSGVDPDDVIYTDDVMERLGTFIWVDIMHQGAMRANRLNGKRFTVVYGDYGVGKTLVAYLTALYCLLHGVTFIMVRAGQDDWRQAFKLARQYKGLCVIFIEDIDTLINVNDPHQVSELLDQLDGLQSKGLDALMVFTTNHIDRIHKGALRPGRTDGVVEIGNMDRTGVEKMVRRRITDLAPDIDFDAVYAACDGFTPAYVVEVVKRTTRANIWRNQGVLTQIDTEDLVHSANGLRPQLALMQAAPEVRHGPRTSLETSLADVISASVDQVVENRLDGANVVRESDGDTWAQLKTN